MAERRFTAIMLLLGTIVTVAYSVCPNSQICECTPNYINCTCLQNEGIEFVRAGQKLAVKELLVTGCGKVRLKEYSLEEANMTSAHLFNLLELHVESLAFQNAKVGDLVIDNIGTITVEDRAFASIANVASFTLRNVTLDTLTSRVFSETTIPSVVIKDSRIRTIDRTSFHLKHSKHITIENNTIDTITTSSFRIESVEDFAFVDNSVQSIAEFSYTFNITENIEFRRCRFEEIPPNMILTKEVQNFEFSKNYIRTCKENAFSGTRECRRINFVENQILISNNNSLIPNEEVTEGSSRKIVSENNEIGCDCGIEWLIATNNPKYNDFKERNVCHYPLDLRGLKLSELEVERSKENECSALSNFYPTGTDVVSTTSASTSKIPRREGNLILFDSTTVTSTESEPSPPVNFGSEKLLKDDQVECKDDSNSAKVYQLSGITLTLALTISIN